MHKDIFFETIRCEDYELFNISFHEKRIARTIGLNLNLRDYIYPPTNELLRCKLIYDESSIISVEFFPYKKKIINTFKIVKVEDIDYSKKFLNRKCLDKLFEKKQNANEIIIVKDNLVTDTSIANIAIFDGDNWLTPKKPLLLGTTRDRLIQNGSLIEKDIDINMLKTAKKIGLMNAMIDFDILEDYSFLL